MVISRFLRWAPQVLLAVAFVLITQSPAFADISTAACNAAGLFVGNAGKGVATLGIATIGILATFGRVTWTQALVVGVGITTLFTAAYIAVDLGSTTMCP